MPELSIIVPVYNAEKYLRRCLDSILNQTYKDFELIVIDDGSPDNCGNIAEDYAAKDKRIAVIHQLNAGVSESRNTGINCARGKYIGFVDSDDYIEPDMYQKMIQMLKLRKLDLVVCGYCYIDSYGDSEYVDFSCVQSLMDSRLFFEYLFNTPRTITGSVWNKLFVRKKISTLFDKKISIGEDWIFVSRYVLNCRKIGFLNKYYYNVYLNKNSATRKVYGKTALGLAPCRQLISLVSVMDQTIQELAEKNYLNTCIRHYNLLRNDKEDIYYNITISDLRSYVRKHGFRIIKNSSLSWKLKLLVFTAVIRG